MNAVSRDTSGDAALRMGLALLNAGNARGACNHFHAALSADPSNTQALQGLVRARLALNDLVEAGDIADRLAYAAPNEASTHEMRARVYLRRGALPQAAAAAEMVIAAAPTSAMGFHLLAAARIAQKRYRDALTATVDARKRAPNWPIPMAQSGWAKLELNGPSAARADIDEAFRLAPKDPYVRKVAAMLAIASGEIRRGRELCESILRENVNDTMALKLFVLSEGPFPLHRRVYRWRYFYKSAGLVVRLLMFLGLCLVIFTLLVLAGRWPVISFLLFGVWCWGAYEKRQRKQRVIAHFAAPKVRN